MALPKELPPDWIGVKVEVAFGSAIMDPRSGAVKFNTFSATILKDFPEHLELDDGEKLRLYPKSAIAYLSTKKALDTSDRAVAAGSSLIVSSR